jgi:hypothetical protein
MLTDLMGGELTVHQHAGAGLGVPCQAVPARGAWRRRRTSVHRAAAPRARAATLGRGAACWWWTTKRPTANCWCTCWSPLGFELRTAASGHDALDLLAAGHRPDAVLMDLAMPGIDGWETIAACASSSGPGRPTRR